MDAEAREEFRAYVEARSPALLRTAYLLTGSRSDAEDLLQTALARLFLAWPRVRDRGALDGYVRRTMLNTRTSWWRRRRVQEVSADHPPEPRDAAARDLGEDLALHDALWAALARLPGRQRAALVLRFYEDLSEADTAAALGVSVGTVKSTTSRGLARLRAEVLAAGVADDERVAVPATAAAPVPHPTPGAPR